MSETNHTEGSITKSVRNYFNNGYNYRVNNAFIFAPDWESDFFCMSRSGYAIEVEVKISRSDFLADMKKKKHEIFKHGYYTERHSSRVTGLFQETERRIEKKFIPNQFYYAVPDGLISVNEVPEYAGLITTKYGITIVKRAPYIHKRKLEVRKVLCDKFYYRWQDEKRRNNLMDYDYKELIKKMNRFKAEFPNEYGKLYAL